MIRQLVRKWWLWNKGFLGNNKGNIRKMFTPPKSKSPWSAMTAGSTNGWASGAEAWGPALTMAAGAIPVAGPFISAGMGAAGTMGGGSGFQGADAGWGNVGSTLLGAAGGYGAGMLGSGIAGGVKSMLGGMPSGAASTFTAGQTAANSGTWGQGMLGNFGSGFGQGLQNYAPWASGAIQNIGGGINSMLGGGATGATGATGAIGGAGGGATGGAGALDFLKNPMTLLGLGSMALSQMKTDVKPPDIGPIASKWLTTDAVTKAGQLAKDIGSVEYLGDFAVDKETQAFMEVSQKEIEKSYKIRGQNLDKMAKATNQQWMGSGERLEMQRRLGEEMTNEVDQMRAQWLFAAKQTYSKNKYDYVMESIKQDDAVKQELLYADIADVVWKYNIDEASVINLRTIAKDAGLYMFKQGVTS